MQADEQYVSSKNLVLMAMDRSPEGTKNKNKRSQNVVMLHIKLNGMEQIINCLQIVFPYTHP